MRSPPHIPNHRPSEIHVALSEIGIAILIGMGLAMTAVMSSLDAHAQLLGAWLMQAGGIALGAGIGAAMGWWWTRRPLRRHPNSRGPQYARSAPSFRHPHHA